MRTAPMTTLLEWAISGHGGKERWDAISRFQAVLSMSGALWNLKETPGLFEHVTVGGETRDQRVTITPFPEPGKYATWEPHRETIETTDGLVVAECAEPASLFKGHRRQAPWDTLHAAYFAAEANWNYFVTPFIFARPDFATEEIEPWNENGEVWRSLRVTYPNSIAAHTKQQTHYFDNAGLLRRIDYSVDILGGCPAVHYPSIYREFDGIMVPIRRQVFERNPDGSAAREAVSIAIDVNHVVFT
jgi:hypothetical protein